MNDWLNFTDKVALVTGAASGMGLATARAFAAAGAAVVLADVREAFVQMAVAELVANGHRAIGVSCDVSDDAQVAAMVDRTVAEFGRLDAAFNNAGVMAAIAPTADSTLEEWERVIGINLRGGWSCMKHELPQMVRQGGGTIVNCSSVGGFRGNPGISSYIASKHGVIGLTRTTALEALNLELGIRRLMLEGGGAANGALLQAGLVDELSLIVAPSVEGVPGDPAVFDVHGQQGALDKMGMALESCQVLESGCVWLRYRFSWDT